MHTIPMTAPPPTDFPTIDAPPLDPPRPAPPLDLAIVILNYNTRDLLRDCLRSLLNTRGDFSWQVVVVDNASRDGSVDMVREEFVSALDQERFHLIENRVNSGFSAGNNVALRWLGFDDATGSTQQTSPPNPLSLEERGLHPTRRRRTNSEGERLNARHIVMQQHDDLPRYVLLLNPDTLVPPTTLAEMLAFLAAHPNAGAAGPRVRRLDGSLDRACRRSFPTPQVSFYRMLGLSRLFPGSRRFNAYNLEYLPEDAVHEVDAVVGAFMLVRSEAILDAGLLDEQFFMYGEDLDWAKRIRDAGWSVWYNGQVEMTHVKEAASRQSGQARVAFYEAMWLFYRKHYRRETPWLLEKLIAAGIAVKGGLDLMRYLWRFCR